MVLLRAVLVEETVRSGNHGSRSETVQRRVCLGKFGWKQLNLSPAKNGRPRKGVARFFVFGWLMFDGWRWHKMIRIGGELEN
jgi:hypothetical protein